MVPAVGSENAEGDLAGRQTWRPAPKRQANQDDVALEGVALDGVSPGQALPLTTASVSALQRLAGNSAVTSRIRGRAVQRHPEGAGLSVDPGAAMADQAATDASGAVALPDGGAAPGGAGGPGAGGPGEAVPGGASPTPAPGASPAPGPDAAPAPGSGPGAEAPSAEGIFDLIARLWSGKGKTPPPAPAKPAYLDLSQAQAALQKSYGSVKAITTGKIEFLDSQDEAWTKYDDLCVAGNVGNPKTHQPWKAGDAKIAYPFGLNGFNWEGTSYINKASALSTTTPHEMMHGNTAPGFRSAVGETLNEGCTQWLTIQALNAANIPLPASIPYAGEVSVAQALVDLVGSAKLTDAYLNGGGAIAALTKAVDDTLGDGTFAKAKAAGDGKDFAGAKQALSTAGMGDLGAPTDTAMA